MDFGNVRTNIFTRWVRPFVGKVAAADHDNSLLGFLSAFFRREEIVNVR